MIAAYRYVPTAVYGELSLVRDRRQWGGKRYGAAYAIGEHYLVGTRLCVGLLYGSPERAGARVVGVGYGEGSRPCRAHQHYCQQQHRREHRKDTNPKEKVR